MYVSLHSHTYYSELDALNSPAEYMARCKELGMPAMAITDHGNMRGHRDFQRASKQAGVKGILGMEGYITHDRFDKRSKAKRTDGTSVYNHITLLAQDQRGLDTLNRLAEKSWNEGYYFKPRMDTELLFDDNEGLIVLSGCMSGMIAKALERGDRAAAEKWAVDYKAALGDRFYIEVMGSNSAELNNTLLEIADKYGIQPVMTSDCHYANKEDLWVEEAMLILSTNPKPDFKVDFARSQKMEMLERFNYLYPGRTMTFQEIEVYMRDFKTEKELFVAQGIERDDIFQNTLVIADRVGEYEYYDGLDLLPRPKAEDPAVLLRKRAYAGLRNRGLDKKPEYVNRIEDELGVISGKGFDPYFIVVANTLRWAKQQGIRIGPGRGSGAGSLVNYALGITDVDPIKFNLLFFRFLDPSRPDWPDVDIDVMDSRRGEVKEYLARQYKNVASIITINRYGGKSAIKAAAKVFRVPLSDVNRATKDNDGPNGVNYLDYFAESEKGKVFLKKYPEVMPLARRLDGRISNTGMHAAGIVVSKEPIFNYVPMETAKDPNDKDGPRIPMVAYDMDEVADIGLIKMDFLGLKGMTIIDDALKYIALRKGQKIDPLDIPLEDAKVYDMISKGYTKGCFQIEAVPYTSLILRMGGIHSFDELAASNALVRPGAMNTIGPEYIARKNGQSMVQYAHPCMQDFTKTTYGEILYQEQVMLTMTELAGMDMGTANKVRKIIGKKKDPALFEQFHDEFVAGASQKVSKQVAEKLWKDFEAHAGYSFNLSHAVAYSMVSYWMAWLKYYYPVEFMAAVLRNEKDKDAVTDYLIECKRMGIKVLLPHVNKSGFTVEPEGKDGIRLGLTSIKFIATKAANNLLAQRPFEDYAELQKRAGEKGSGITTTMLRALNAIGAARFHDNPLRGNERENFYEYLKIPAFGHIDLEPVVRFKFMPLDEYSEKGVFPVLGMVRGIKRGDGWARVEMVSEQGSVGIFASQDIAVDAGEMYAFLVADNRIVRYATIEELYGKINNEFVRYMYDEAPVPKDDDQYYTVAFRKYRTKAGKDMAYIVAMDKFGVLHHILCFSSNYAQARILCRNGKTWRAEIGEMEDGTKIVRALK